MYEQFYGLKENPFDVTPDPQYIYLGENHREAFSQLLYGVRKRKGFIVITGEVGTGKTTLIHYFLDKLKENNHIKTAFLFNPRLTANDFLKYILEDLGVKIFGRSKGDYLHSFHSYLLNAFKLDVRVVLIVDEAQKLDPELLEEIRLLSNLETSKSKLIQIILVGQPELNETLSKPEFRQLRQRINLRYHLLPLTENETKEYIEKRLRVGGAKKTIFSEKAIKEIYRKSNGIPRLINILCDNSLLNGYALDQKIVDEKSVKEVVKDLNLKQGFHRSWNWIIIPLCVIGIALIILLLRKSGLIVPLYKGILQSFHNIEDTAINGLQNVLNILK